MNTKDIPQIRDFALIKRQDPYVAPERQANVVGGKIYNHPRVDDGKGIQTSQVQKVEGRIVHTRNSVYRLYGRPKKEFLDWLKTVGIEYDSKNPLKGLEAYF